MTHHWQLLVLNNDKSMSCKINIIMKRSLRKPPWQKVAIQYKSTSFKSEMQMQYKLFETMGARKALLYFKNVRLILWRGGPQDSNNSRRGTDIQHFIVNYLASPHFPFESLKMPIWSDSRFGVQRCSPSGEHRKITSFCWLKLAFRNLDLWPRDRCFDHLEFDLSIYNFLLTSFMLLFNNIFMIILMTI